MSRRRRRLMLAGALGNPHVPATVVNDTFTDANAVALTAHVGEIGATWAHYSGANAGAIQDNRVFGGDAGAYIASGVPLSANYYVEALIDLITDLGTDNVGVIGRAVVGADSYYLARYAASNDSWALFTITGGVAQQIGSSFIDDWTTGSRVVRLDMQGSTIRVLTGGVERISVVDTTFAASGRAGLRWGAVQATTTGRHITQMVAFG